MAGSLIARVRRAVAVAVTSALLLAIAPATTQAVGIQPVGMQGSSRSIVIGSGYQTIPLEAPFEIIAAAGQKYYLEGRLLAWNQATNNVEQQVGISCLSGAAQPEARTSRNNEPSRVYPGYSVAGRLELYVRYLFEPTSSGTYYCQLWVKASSTSATGTFTVLRNDESGQLKTYLDDLKDANQPGARQWWQPSANGGTCTGNDNGATPYCFYIESGGSGYALSDASFIASSTATSVTIYAGLEASTCKTGSDTCHSSHQSSVGYSDVSARLEAVQLDSLTAPGYACGPWTTSATQTPRISFDAHHYKTHFTLTVPIRTSATGCTPTRRMLIRVYVQVTGGDDLKLDSNLFSNGIALNVP